MFCFCVLNVFGSSDTEVKTQILDIVKERSTYLEDFSKSLEEGQTVSFVQRHRGKTAVDIYQRKTLSDPSVLNFSIWNLANTSLVLYQIIGSMVNSIDNENILLYSIQKILSGFGITYSVHKHELPKTEGDDFCRQLDLEESKYFDTIQGLLFQKCEIDPVYYGEQTDRFDGSKEKMAKSIEELQFISELFKNKYEETVLLLQQSITPKELSERFNLLGDQFDELCEYSKKIIGSFEKTRFIFSEIAAQILGEPKKTEYFAYIKTNLGKTEKEELRKIKLMKKLIFSDDENRNKSQLSRFLDCTRWFYGWDRNMFLIKMIKEYLRELDVLIRRRNNIMEPLNKLKKSEEQKRTELEIENTCALEELLQENYAFTQKHLFSIEEQKRQIIQGEQAKLFESLQNEFSGEYANLPWQAHLSFSDHQSHYQQEEKTPFQTCEPKVNTAVFFQGTELRRIIDGLKEGASIPQKDVVTALEAFGYLHRNQGSECTYQIWDPSGNIHVAFIHLRHGTDTIWTKKDWRYKRIIDVLQRAGFLEATVSESVQTHSLPHNPFAALQIETNLAQV